MEKTAIFESQINSLKEIIQIQEKQLSTTTNESQDVLSEWRVKVYELLVKNNFLNKQNKEFLNELDRYKKEKNMYWKRNMNDLVQKDSEISQIRSKLNIFNMEKEDFLHKIEYLEVQNRSLKEEQISIKNHFQELMNSQNKNFSEKVSELMIKLNEKENQIKDHCSKSNHLESKIRELNGQKGELEAKIDELNDKILNLNQEVIDYCFQTISYKKLDIANRISRDVDKEKAEAKVLQKESSFQIKRLEAKLKEETDNKLVLESKLSDMIAEIAGLKEEIESNNKNHKDILEKIKNEGKAQQNVFVDQIKCLEMKIQNQDQEKSALETKIREMNFEISGQKEKLLQNQRVISHIEKERDDNKIQYQELNTKFMQLEELRNQQMEELKLVVKTTEIARQDEIKRLKHEYEVKMNTIENQKDNIINSLRMELENVKIKSEREIEVLERSVENYKEKTVSLFNQINDLLKTIELKDRTLKKYESQALNLSQANKIDFPKGTTTSKKNQYFSLETPQTKITRRIERDENKSLLQDQEWLKFGKTSFGTEKQNILEMSSMNNNTKLSKLEAVETLASDLLADDDDNI